MEKSGVIFALFRDDKILMQQRDKNCKKFPCMWCLPGGGREVNEDFEETLLREVKEEYGIDLDLDNCIHLMDYNNGANNKVFVCKINSSQDPKLNEGMAMEWMTLDEVSKLKIGFDQGGIISVLRDWLLKNKNNLEK